MLAHPTLDQLNALGLYGLAKGFKELEHKPEVRGLDHAEWLGLLLEYELTLRRLKQFETRARVARLRHPASVEDVNYQVLAGSTARCSSSSPPATGSPSAAVCSSPGRAAWARVGSPAPLATRRAEKTSPSSIPACPGSSPISPSPTATPATPGSCAPWRASSCSSSTIGAQRRSPPNMRATCSKSSRIATTRARSSSPARFPWTAGMT